MDENRNGDNNKSPQNKRIFFACLIVTLIMVVFFSYFTKNMSKGEVQEITYDNFLSMLDNDNVSEVLIKSDRLVIQLARLYEEAGIQKMGFWRIGQEDPAVWNWFKIVK